ncbi:MAG TPA: hypothetical protein VGU02_10745 [Gaiellaceae bacterium]|nr:hypothetical protein [Gaiellaceae bacterium]
MPVVAAFAALVAAAPAWAHPRAATVAIDYRVTVRSVPGVDATVLDGDRSLRLRTNGHLTVLGDLREPMLRIGDGVFVNLSSPTAQADRLVKQPSHGWKRLASGSSFTWHEHRLSPPPFESGRYGVVARWSVPVVVDGRHGAVGGAFVRVARPHWWLWLGAALLVAVAGGAWLSRGRARGGAVAIAAFALAAAAAIACQVALLLRDSPSGRLSWFGLAAGIALAIGAIALVVLGRGITRIYTAGGIGAGIAAWALSWFGVFFHGAVIAALPGALVRALCATAVACGLVAVAGSLTVHE